MVYKPTNITGGGHHLAGMSFCRDELSWNQLSYRWGDPEKTLSEYSIDYSTISDRATISTPSKKRGADDISAEIPKSLMNR